ncbi:acyltransferase domain-containing protein [Streptomyces sp. M19]
MGDPIEAQALIETYGQGRAPGRPLWLGSLKSNIGHTQAAAGIAGVIKAVLALRHGVLPRTLHVDRPSPHVGWRAGAVELLTEARPWPETGSRAGRGLVLRRQRHQRPRHPRTGPGTNGGGTGISTRTGSGGGTGSGTRTGSGDRALPWVLSGKSEAALRDQARRLLAHLRDRPEATCADIGHSLLTSRTLFDHRGVVVGEDRAALLAGLTALAEERRDGRNWGKRGGRRTGTGHGPGGRRPQDGVRLPGQGSQWVGMGAELWDASPVFRRELRACAAALEPYVDWPVVDVVRGTPDAAPLDRVDVVQPALWAVMVSLAAVWRSMGSARRRWWGTARGDRRRVRGGRPVAGDAARAVALRARALTALSGTGAMVSLALPVAQVRERLTRWDGRISVAAVNGPVSVAVAGDRDALAELVRSCEDDEVSTWWLPVDYASHSPHVERVREDLLEALEPIRPRPATVPMLSTVTGAYLSGPELDAGYWYRNLRGTVEFADAVAGLAAAGHRAFVEVSPHPVLTLGCGSWPRPSPPTRSWWARCAATKAARTA